MYAREGTFSLFSLPSRPYPQYPRNAIERPRHGARTYLVLNFPGWYALHEMVSSDTHFPTLCQKTSSGRLDGSRRTTVFRRSVCDFWLPLPEDLDFFSFSLSLPLNFGGLDVSAVDMGVVLVNEMG